LKSRHNEPQTTPEQFEIIIRIDKDLIKTSKDQKAFITEEAIQVVKLAMENYNEV